MMAAPSKNDTRRKRHARLRRKLSGSGERPRLLIRRTLHHIYASVVDDARGHTLVTASTREKDLSDGLGSKTNLAAAEKIGQAIAAKAQQAGITQVVFDRSGLKYHGRVKALADAARQAGLEF
ncbi:MAG: 50S ribosomal protein L18 [Candidatus Baltobacteraceae bacterium]